MQLRAGLLPAGMLMQSRMLVHALFRSLEIGIGMYQTSSKPVDVQKFNSFQRPITSFLIIRIEPDGNLKGYYWDGSNWVLNYQAIAETCDLEPFNFILHSEFDY